MFDNLIEMIYQTVRFILLFTVIIWEKVEFFVG